MKRLKNFHKVYTLEEKCTPKALGNTKVSLATYYPVGLTTQSSEIHELKLPCYSNAWGQQ